MKTVQELTSKCVQVLNQCKQVHFLWHYTNLCCSNTVWSLCGVLYCLLNIARLACFVRILYIQFNDVWKNPKKQPGKPSLWNCCEALSIFPQHIFTFSKYSCQTILFRILRVLSPSSSLYYFCCSYYFFPRSKFLTCLQPLKRAAFGRSGPLPHQPTTSGAGTSHSPTAGAGGHGGSWPGQGEGQVGEGGGQLSHFGMGCKRPGTVSYLQLLGAVFRPLPGLCFQLYHCFWRKSLLEKEKERSNWDSSCLCCLLQFKI